MSAYVENVKTKCAGKEICVCARRCIVYDIGNMEHEIEEEFNSYIGNVTAELFQLVSINQIEVRDLQNGWSLLKSFTDYDFCRSLI